MIIDGERVAAASIGFKRLFDEELAKSPDMKIAELLGMRIESGGSEESINWLGATPMMERWTADRTLMNLRANAITIVNEPWAIGITVHQDDLADDKIGIIAPKIRSLATSAGQTFVNALVGRLTAGFADFAYDGQYFFDTDHQDGTGPIQSNKVSGALSSTTYDEAIAKMMSVLDENGNPISATPTHLVVGPALRRTARDILVADALASGASNTNAGTTELVISPRLTGADALKWFVLDCSKPLRPLILQMRQEPTFTAMDSPGSEGRFMRGLLVYGCEARFGAGYGLWQLAVGSTGA